MTSSRGWLCWLTHLKWHRVQHWFIWIVALQKCLKVKTTSLRKYLAMRKSLIVPLIRNTGAYLHNHSTTVIIVTLWVVAVMDSRMVLVWSSWLVPVHRVFARLTLEIPPVPVKCLLTHHRHFLVFCYYSRSETTVRSRYYDDFHDDVADDDLLPQKQLSRGRCVDVDPVITWSTWV